MLLMSFEFFLIRKYKEVRGAGSLRIYTREWLYTGGTEESKPVGTGYYMSKILKKMIIHKMAVKEFQRDKDSKRRGLKMDEKTL